MQSGMLGPLLSPSDAEYPDYSVTHLKAADQLVLYYKFHDFVSVKLNLHDVEG